MEFECVFRETEEMITRMYRKVFFPIRFVISLIFWLFAIYFGKRAIETGNIRMALLVLGYLFFALYYCFWHRIAARKAVKRKRAYYDGRELTLTARFGEAIVVMDEDSVNKYPYHKIQSISSDGKYMYFRLSRGWFCICIENFTKGTAEELKPFLTEHCPQAKLFWNK